jgi:hypothetical protein
MGEGKTIKENRIIILGASEWGALQRLLERIEEE